MADRFWVGGGASTNWNATGNTNWSATSGGANNASVPGTGDLAIFDSNSGVGNSVISANITVQGLDCTGGTGNYAGTITHNNSVTLTINTGAASSLRFASGMTYTALGVGSLVTFTHTSGTANITSNGKRLWALTINGAGGTTALLDDILVNAGSGAVLTVTSGIFDANTFAITACLLAFSGAVTRSVIFGSGVTLGGNVANGAQVLNAATITNLTFTKNSANITVLTPTSAIMGIVFQGGALTYNDLILNAASNQTKLLFSQAATFAHLTVGVGWNIALDSSVTVTVSNPFTFAGTQANPTLVFGVGASAGTLSCPSGACTLTWGGLFGVTGSGGATFTATNTFNFGTSSGWSISPPADATTAVPTVAQIATAVWQDTTAGDFTAAGSIGKSVMNGVALGTGLTINAYTGNTAQTGDAFARLGAPAGASVSADVAAVKVDSAAILVDTGTTLDAAIADLPTNAELATALAAADDAVLAAIAALNDIAATDIVSGGAITTSGGIASADIKKVNAVTVNGDGSGTPWGP